MSAPKRIQRRRTAGWRMPEDAVYVGRPSRWGNPWVVGEGAATRRWAVDSFERHLRVRRSPGPGWVDVLHYPTDDEIRAELAGRDLACWCPLDQPCHGDVLLEVANR